MANVIACSAPWAGKVPTDVAVNITVNAAIAHRCHFLAFTINPPYLFREYKESGIQYK
jgi:hypothetical protein